MIRRIFLAEIGVLLGTAIVAAQQTAVVVKAAVAPLYPPIAVAARAEGDVVVRVAVGPDGSVLHAEVVSGPRILQQSATEAAEKWKFETSDPATTNRSSEIKFSYVLLSEDAKEESETVFLPPDAVVLRHRPAKPTVNYGAQSAPATDTLLHEASHVQDAAVNHDMPVLQGAALPVYPPIGRAASVTGKVIVEMTVSGGKVTGTEVKSGARMLADGTVANLQTWRFASDVSGKFTVTYTYAISGEATDSLMNPTVEMLPSLDVNITARPVKPIVMYGVQSVPATDTLLHESGHVQAAARQ
jgi:TonB family protein